MLLGSTLPDRWNLQVRRFPLFTQSCIPWSLGLSLRCICGTFSVECSGTGILHERNLNGISVVPVAFDNFTFFYVVNLLGLKTASIVEIVFVALLFVAIAIYTVPGVAKIDRNLEGLFSTGLGPMIYASALLTFTFAGSNAVIELGGEVENPRKSPLSVMLSLSIVLICYLLMAIVSLEWEKR